jgi:hypothetical protein
VEFVFDVYVVLRCYAMAQVTHISIHVVNDMTLVKHKWHPVLKLLKERYEAFLAEIAGGKAHDQLGSHRSRHYF